ncbi:hypothetical protein SERLA73DRAFT_171951 [Serpula lacrymans var. lacrymans S7.3]|uniref:Uncharacterized protein n=1 Tax=Serpula lacrymans var. lacrymans (strain S7.3) TaxID=936435 RepID=F8QDF9_SERL3|nr:hypothetical protein SERLA73DRAFT_171951 [Serpula lacrymans var. lacrymans S7.3]
MIDAKRVARQVFASYDARTVVPPNFAPDARGTRRSREGCRNVCIIYFNPLYLSSPTLLYGFSRPTWRRLIGCNREIKSDQQCRTLHAISFNACQVFTFANNPPPQSSTQSYAYSQHSIGYTRTASNAFSLSSLS